MCLVGYLKRYPVYRIGNAAMFHSWDTNDLSVTPDNLQSLPTLLDERRKPTVPVQTIVTAIFEIGVKGKLDPQKPHYPPPQSESHHNKNLTTFHKSSSQSPFS